VRSFVIFVQTASPSLIKEEEYEGTQNGEIGSHSTSRMRGHYFISLTRLLFAMILL
jgi:hypothetical protein